MKQVASVRSMIDASSSDGADCGAMYQRATLFLSYVRRDTCTSWLTVAAIIVSNNDAVADGVM
jgi:hypothetical protein